MNRAHYLKYFIVLLDYIVFLESRRHYTKLNAYDYDKLFTMMLVKLASRDASS